MRLVQVSIPAGKRELVADVLDEEGVDYMLTDETSGREYTAIAYFPLPTAAVQPVLDKLQDAGLGEDPHAVIIDAETDVSRQYEELERRYSEENPDATTIAREEIRTEAREMTPEFPTFVAMTVISAVVATAGMLLDSPAVVVGSMVIAPLIGPAMGASVGTVLGDRQLFRRGVKYQFIGGFSAIAAATLFAVVVRYGFLVPPETDILGISQVSGRLTPDFLSLAVALGAGAAGVLSLASGVSVAIVGVMIAAALVPPAAAVGIAIAWWQPMAAVSSFVLVLVNILSINLAGLAVLWYLDYGPKNLFEHDQTRSALFKRAGVLVAAIGLLSLFLGGVTFATIQEAQFQNQVRQEAGDVLDGGAYDEARLFDMEFRGSGSLPFDQSQRVVVTVGRPPDTAYPDLAETLTRRINRNSGHRVAVQVRYVEYDGGTK
ncbi:MULTISPECIES: TIGR00341 family protein [Halorussus]|uniref:TIGR00341 family protein n=1 Tax=Halorussus TaxID=1070314 RepID=UPI000E212791|nr:MULTISPECIES: TIGR00341 family protein [Halorussus]NHN61120.1 TIGR00341 family protein [Halorussus sp. JP-T4]